LLTAVYIRLLQVEGAPKVVKEGLKKDEAEALQKTLVEGGSRCCSVLPPSCGS
jgi:hypothetical protein